MSAQSQESEAKRQGYRAYKRGARIENNPYPEGSQNRSDWEQGWLLAELNQEPEDR